MKVGFTLLFLIIFINQLFSATYQIAETENNQVKFFASATLGGFTGTTNRISGHVKWTGTDTLTTSEVLFEVPLDSLDTGIGMRNGHMRDKYLETGEYPLAIYQGQLTSWEKIGEQKYQLETEGTMQIHGVEKPFSVEATAYQVNGKLRIIFNYKLDITDYGIKKPRFLISSMDEEITLRLNFYLKPQ